MERDLTLLLIHFVIVKQDTGFRKKKVDRVLKSKFDVFLYYFQKFYVKNSPTGEVGIFVCIVRSESSDCFFGIGLGRLE